MYPKTHNGVFTLIFMEKQKKNENYGLYLKKFEKNIDFTKTEKSLRV